MKKKLIKIALEKQQINFSNGLRSKSEITKKQHNEKTPIPIVEPTQLQEINPIIRPSFKEINPTPKHLVTGLVCVPDKPISLQLFSKTIPTFQVLSILALTIAICLDKIWPYFFPFPLKQKKKNKILELEISCPFSINDTIMTSFSKDDVLAGDVGIVIGTKYNPFRGVVDFSNSHKYKLSNKDYLVQKTDNQGLRIIFQTNKK